MRIISLFKKAIIENLRDWKILILILTFAPFFVLLMYFYIDNAETHYKVGFVNLDRGVTDVSGSPSNAGRALIDQLKSIQNTEGMGNLEVYQESDMTLARDRVKDKSWDLLVVLPEDFSKVLLD